MLGNTVALGACLVTGAAGSGKTTFLRNRYVELARAGERGILMLVHGRRQARALSDQILADLGESTDQVRVATWHAFGLSLLRAHHRLLGYAREPGLLTGPEQFTLVREMLESPEERAHWTAFPRQLRLASFVEELREFVLRAQDALRSPEELATRARELGRPDLEQASLFFRRYLDRIDAREDAVVDHANVIARAWQLLEQSAEVKEEVTRDTRHLIVDDLHDVTPAQRELLGSLFVEGGSVTVAANPAARIFGFRGSDAGSLDRFKADFEPVREVVLDTNHRGEPVRDAWVFDHLTEEAEAIARECRRLRAREGVPWGRIAIVVRRFGSASRAIRRALDRATVPFVVVGENRPLAAEPALIPMLELARAALRPEEREERLPKLLASPVARLDPYEVRALRREARLRDTSLTTLVAAPPDDFPEDLRARLLELTVLIDEVADRDMRDRPDEVFWFMWERLDHFREMVEQNDEDSLDAVAAFARAIERFADRRRGKRFGDYLDALEGVEFGPEPWNMPEERRPDAVRIMTAHASAGEEFDAVIVAGCVDGEFPDARDPRPMLDLRDLLAPGTPFERRSARLEEEARLFGVATARARMRLLITAARESSQREALAPSPLVRLAGLEWVRPSSDGAHGWDDALTRDEAEAQARTVLRDLRVPDDDRRAALSLLAKLPGVDPGSWWYERDWTDPGTDLIGEEFRTSYSRLSPYENCGLQYLYQVVLGLDTEQTHAMLVGSWVHDIVDRCAKKEIECDEEALLAELARVWNPDVFPSTAIEHRMRIESEKMLKRWIDADGKVEPLATEVGFEFPVEGATIRGYIDRIVRCGGKSVRLTDYKTGKSGKSQQQTEEDLQLATYFLAMKRDPELARFGDPMYLELAFLGRESRMSGFWRPHFDPRRDPEFEQKTEGRLVELVQGIRAEKFEPKPDADCMWCKFRSLCPVWAEGDEVKL